MNLSDLASFIGSKVRKSDSDSLSACKEYLRQRDRMLYDAKLWRASVFEFTLALAPATNTLHAAGVVLLPKVVDKVLAARLPSAQLWPARMEEFFQSSFDRFAQSAGQPAEFNVLPPVCYQTPTAKTLQVYNAGTGPDTVQVRWIDSANALQKSSLSVTSTAQDIGSVLMVEGVEKLATTAAINIKESGGSDVVTLAAADTRAEPNERIQLFPAPSTATTLRLLVKKKYEPLTHDSEIPRLGAVAENVLIAFAKGDMHERSRQFAKAQAAFGEGMALLEALANVEFYQQINPVRLVPEVEPDAMSWYAGDFSTKGYW